jgi:hypothetical protein
MMAIYMVTAIEDKCFIQPIIYHALQLVKAVLFCSPVVVPVLFYLACLKPDNLSLDKEEVNQAAISAIWTMPTCPNTNLPITQYHVTATSANATQVFDGILFRDATDLAISLPERNTTYNVAVFGINCFGETEPAKLTIGILARSVTVSVVLAIEFPYFDVL